MVMSSGRAAVLLPGCASVFVRSCVVAVAASVLMTLNRGPLLVLADDCTEWLRLFWNHCPSFNVLNFGDSETGRKLMATYELHLSAHLPSAVSKFDVLVCPPQLFASKHVQQVLRKVQWGCGVAVLGIAERQHIWNTCWRLPALQSCAFLVGLDSSPAGISAETQRWLETSFRTVAMLHGLV